MGNLFSEKEACGFESWSEIKFPSKEILETKESSSLCKMKHSRSHLTFKKRFIFEDSTYSSRYFEKDPTFKTPKLLKFAFNFVTLSLSSKDPYHSLKLLCEIEFWSCDFWDKIKRVFSIFSETKEKSSSISMFWKNLLSRKLLTHVLMSLLSKIFPLDHLLK